jgi:predicted TIM-barrel fold metal-dependent hydrolase
MTADAAEVAERARKVNVDLTVVSPLLGLMPRFKADAAVGNEEAVKVVPATPGLMQWVIINPLQPETYEQAETMLKNPWCVGVKIHPEEHGYPIIRYGREIFEFCAARRTIILTHSGETSSMPGDFVPLADDHPEVSLILAHIGCSSDGEPSRQVRAICASRHRNIYADTSSARSVMPKLIEWAVKEAGAEKVLFGTDTPLYHCGMQRARIEIADLNDIEKRMILRDNAYDLLRLPGRAVSKKLSDDESRFACLSNAKIFAGE